MNAADETRMTEFFDQYMDTTAFSEISEMLFKALDEIDLRVLLAEKRDESRYGPKIEHNLFSTYSCGYLLRRNPSSRSRGRSPPMIRIKHRGNFDKTEKLLKSAGYFKAMALLEACGKQGVDALSAATPKDTGLTAASWTYDIVKTSAGYKIVWSNTNVVNSVVIALLLQYGHGTQNGSYVEGRDYINPAMRPVFDELATKLGEEVSKL